MEFLKIYHGKITEALAMVDKSNLNTDRITGIIHYVDDGITITLPASSEIKVITHKLLMYAISVFTSLNGSKTVNNRVISFRLKDFLAKCGVNVNSKPSVDKGRTVIKQAINTLKKLRINVSEGSEKFAVAKNDLQLFKDISTIRNGMVYMAYTEDFAEYLVGRPIAIYPSSLFKCDGKMHNAYRIGYKIALHSSNANNKRVGTANTLKVMTMLNNVCMPKYSDLKNTRQSWRYKIKQNLENALNYLSLIDLLIGWEYREIKTDSYFDYQKSVITFTIRTEELSI